MISISRTSLSALQKVELMILRMCRKKTDELFLQSRISLAQRILTAEH